MEWSGSYKKMGERGVWDSRYLLYVKLNDKYQYVGADYFISEEQYTMSLLVALLKFELSIRIPEYRLNQASCIPTPRFRIGIAKDRQRCEVGKCYVIESWKWICIQ